jgi:uncharacterized coiled-coil protein SlyX
MKTKIRNSGSHSLPLITSHYSLLTVLLLGCFALGFPALAPLAQAQGPDTDGAIAGANNGEGIGVLVSRTSGIWNTGTGFEALNHLTAGNQNTATGLRALFSDTNGGFNTATGVLSLFSNFSGFFNTATGAYSLANSTDGDRNTATGYGALYFNTASNNTATGFGALFKNTTGGTNTAVGSRALESNTEGDINTAVGGTALANNTAGAQNTAVGFTALFLNTTGSHNTAVGQNAGRFITGDGNTALGDQAGRNITSGMNNICIGRDAGFGISTTDNHIAIGLPGENGPSPRCYIGNIRGVTVANADGINVIIDSDGQLGTSNSSRRFKKDIKPMEQASEAILALKPVTFHYKDQDTKKAGDTPQFGLIAEDVAEVNPDLVVYEDNGQPLSVRYDAVNAMLLNEFLKERKKVEEQEATITELQSTVAQQQKDFQSKLAEQEKQIAALASGLQKVSAQVEMSKPATKLVRNNP